jgi:DNA polymerase I-like protein with 3'-5' exonuclease and polymerase domains
MLRVRPDGDRECAECEGTCKTTKKIHGLFGQELFECSYEEVIRDKVKYGKAKSGVFAMTYGGNAKTLEKNLSVSKEIAEKAFTNWGTVLSRHRQVTQAD